MAAAFVPFLPPDNDLDAGIGASSADTVAAVQQNTRSLQTILQLKSLPASTASDVKHFLASYMLYRRRPYEAVPAMEFVEGESDLVPLDAAVFATLTTHPTILDAKLIMDAAAVFRVSNPNSLPSVISSAFRLQPDLLRTLRLRLSTSADVLASVIPVALVEFSNRLQSYLSSNAAEGDVDEEADLKTAIRDLALYAADACFSVSQTLQSSAYCCYALCPDKEVATADHMLSLDSDSPARIFAALISMYEHVVPTVVTLLSIVETELGYETDEKQPSESTNYLQIACISALQATTQFLSTCYLSCIARFTDGAIDGSFPSELLKLQEGVRRDPLVVASMLSSIIARLSNSTSTDVVTAAQRSVPKPVKGSVLLDRAFHKEGSFLRDLCTHTKFVASVSAAFRGKPKPELGLKGKQFIEESQVTYLLSVLADLSAVPTSAQLPAGSQKVVTADPPSDESIHVAIDPREAKLRMIEEALPYTTANSRSSALDLANGDLSAAIDRLLTSSNESSFAAAEIRTPPVAMGLSRHSSTGSRGSRGIPLHLRKGLAAGMDAELRARTRELAVLQNVEAMTELETDMHELVVDVQIDGTGEHIPAVLDRDTGITALIDERDEYNDDYDDVYDTADLLAVPDSGSLEDEGDVGDEAEDKPWRGTSDAARSLLQEPRFARGRGRGGSHSVRSPTAAVQAAGPSATAVSRGASHGAGGRGRGRGEEVTGHGLRAQGGVTERDAIYRREHKARFGNHDRKRGADKKMAKSMGGS